MAKSWAVGCLLALGALHTARAACDALDTYLDVPSPLTDDTTITLSVGVIECPEVEPTRTSSTEIEIIVVDGGTLTIASDNTVQFINVGFLVMPGAALVFDMPETLLGPNSVSTEDFPGGRLFDVSDGASLTFNGDVTIQGIHNVGILLQNYGSTEFKKTVLIEDTFVGLRVISGTLKFRGDATFREMGNQAIGNSDGGFVRFSKTATFDTIRETRGEGAGCLISNDDSTSKMSFRGDAYFSNGNCGNSEAPPVNNRGIMTFYGKARFNDNRSDSNGGAVENKFGSITFRRAVQFNNNQARQNGGGIAVAGGDVTFKRGVTFDGNSARDSGGAFAVLIGENPRVDVIPESDFGSLTFERPSVVRFRDNVVDTTRGDDTESADCTVGEVEEGTTLIGFPDDDVCVTAM